MASVVSRERIDEWMNKRNLFQYTSGRIGAYLILETKRSEILCSSSLFHHWLQITEGRFSDFSRHQTGRDEEHRTSWTLDDLTGVNLAYLSIPKKIEKRFHEANVLHPPTRCECAWSSVKRVCTCCIPT